MQYRNLHKGINTGGDAATSCKNLVNFSAVTPEIMFFYMFTFVLLLSENQSMIYIRRTGISRRFGQLKY